MAPLHVLLSSALLTSCFSAVQAALPNGRAHGNAPPLPLPPVIEIPDRRVEAFRSNGADALPPYNTTYYFDQLIDHTDPSKGTFQQRYWHTWEFYEPDGPIILMTPGEANAAPYTAYLTNVTINGLIAQQEGGATIVLEHRFYGLSNPYPDLTPASLKYHTIQQAIDDLDYFANNVALPMPNGTEVGPDKAPWILIGGSYSGALTSWTMVNKPGLFWAGYASSAVVEAITDFWKYFEPIRQNMPANCSADVAAVIAHVDKTFSGSNKTAINALKDVFSLGEMTHLDDVAGALRNNLWDWQSMQTNTGPGAQFYNFCDALEVKDGEVAPAEGWGLENALTAWGTYWKEVYYADICGDSNPVDCLGTYDPNSEFYTNTEVDNASRSWFWIVCNEVGFYQDGPPKDVVDINPLVSRLVNVDTGYDPRQCQLTFKGAFPTRPLPNVQHVNTDYEGFKVNVDRLFFATGLRDPWREATMSAEGVDVASTDRQPIVESDGFHCSDLSAARGASDPTIGALQKQALASMHTWLQEWAA
ncbi:peptidase S28 [Hymenopellis radicata]|nr:peptidase S28 [Hymenopellis radicata]